MRLVRMINHGRAVHSDTSLTVPRDTGGETSTRVEAASGTMHRARYFLARTSRTHSRPIRSSVENVTFCPRLKTSLAVARPPLSSRPASS